jgi:hypothetical protein
LILINKYFIIHESEEKRVVIYGRIKRASGWCKLVLEIYELAFGVIG